MKPFSRLSLRRAGLLALFSVAAIWSDRSQATVRRALLTVEGLKVASTEAIYNFRIETWGVEFLAVCALPRSWKLESEKSETSEGYLAGSADLQGERLQRLSNMYLVDVYDYRPTTVHEDNGEVPASFKGWVHVGSREQFGDWHGRRVTLGAGNFHLKKATACPAAPPAAP